MNSCSITIIKLFFCLIGIYVVLTENMVFAQESVLLPKHVKRINKRVNPAKKIALYRRYYRRDSLKFVKRTEQYWKATSDSITKAMINRYRLIKNESLISYNKNRDICIPWSKKQAELQVAWLRQHGISVSATSNVMLRNYFEWYYLKAAQNDVMLTIRKRQLSDISFPISLSPDVKNYMDICSRPASIGHSSMLSKQEALQSLNLDNPYSGEIADVSRYTSRDNVASEGQKFKTAQAFNLKGVENIDGIKSQLEQVEGFKGQATQHRKQISQLQDSSYIKEHVKKKAEEQAMCYVADHPEVMQGVRRKMGLLMKKYSLVPNSNDLSSAVKRTSLSGKSLRQRLYLASNLQVISLNPVSIDFSPVVGYRFNTKIIAGVGGTYRQTFSDTISVVAPDVFGYKLFTSYDVLNNFFAYGEIDRDSPGVEKDENESKRIWKNAAFLGVGRKFMVSARVEMTVVMMYNFLHENFDPVYPKAWVIRVGFQTSQLAFLKK